MSTLCRRKLRNGNSDHSTSSALSWQDHFRCNGCLFNDSSFGAKEFPSWSWCGWMHGKCEYEMGMLDGCFPHVQGWLRSKTWILWYIRDQEGNLRPLWDRHSLGEDISKDERWRGYSGHNTRTVSATTSNTSPPSGNQQSRRADRNVPTATVQVAEVGPIEYYGGRRPGRESKKPPTPKSDDSESDTESSTERSQDERTRHVRFRSRPSDVSKFAPPPPTGEDWVRHSNRPYLDSVVHRYYDDGDTDGKTPEEESRYTPRPRRAARDSVFHESAAHLPSGTKAPPLPTPSNST